MKEKRGSMKLNYSYTEEEFRSDLDDKSITTTKKVAYDDLTPYQVYKVLEDLDKIWEISVSLKLKPLPEDEGGDDDEQPNDGGQPAA